MPATPEVKIRLTVDAAGVSTGISGAAKSLGNLEGAANAAASASSRLQQATARIGQNSGEGFAGVSSMLQKIPAQVDSAAAALGRTFAATPSDAGAAAAAVAAATARIQSATAQAAEQARNSAGQATQAWARLPAQLQSGGRVGAAALQQVGDQSTRLTSQLASVERATTGVSTSLARVAGASVVFSAVTGAAQAAANALTALPRQGLAFASSMQIAELGIAGVLGSMGEVNGQALSFAQSAAVAKSITAALADDAMRTAASTEELVGAFQALVGPGLAAGGTIEQIQRLTTTGVIATKALGLQAGQVVQELRDLVQGGITPASSTLATALGLKDADIQKAKASSEGLFVFLEKRMAGFSEAGNAYGSTLSGAVQQAAEAAQRRAATAFAPLVTVITSQAQQLSQVLQDPEATAGLDRIGEAAAGAASALGTGLQVALRYSDAIMLLAGAIGAVKLGGLVTGLVQATAAKIEAVQASRLSAMQAAAEAASNTTVTQSTVAKIAAYRAELAAAAESAVAKRTFIAAQLAQAEAAAAAATGMARLAIVERSVIPLRAQLTAQTAAATVATNALNAATTAASASSRAMGAVMGALGGPIGIAITAVASLVMWLASAKSEADKLAKTKLSTGRIETALQQGKAPDQADASRLASRISDLKEQRDDLTLAMRGMYGRTASNVESLNAVNSELQNLEALQRRVEAAQAQGAQAGGDAAEGIGLKAGASRKQLDELFASVSTASTIAEQAREKLGALDKAWADERARMVQRGTPQADIDKDASRYAETRKRIERDLQKALREEASQAAARARAIGEAQDALTLAQAKAASAEAVRLLEQRQAGIEAAQAAGLMSAQAAADALLGIELERLAQQEALIQREIDLEKRRPVPAGDAAAKLQQQQKLVTLNAGLKEVQQQRQAAPRLAQDAGELRRLEEARSAAQEWAALWVQAQDAAQQSADSTAQAMASLIVDPVERARRETSLTIAQIERDAAKLRQALDLKIDTTRGAATAAAERGDTGQAESLTAQARALEQQRDQLNARTNDAIAARGRLLADQLKPAWQRMVEGWGDATQQMRDSYERLTTGIVEGGEQAFTEFARSGKVSVESIGATIRAELARTAYRQLISSLTGPSLAPVSGQGLSLAGVTAGSQGGAPQSIFSLGSAAASGGITPLFQRSTGPRLGGGGADASSALSGAAQAAGDLSQSAATSATSLAQQAQTVTQAGAAQQALTAVTQTSQAQETESAIQQAAETSIVSTAIRALGDSALEAALKLKTAAAISSAGGAAGAATGAVFTGTARFAAGGTFTNRVVGSSTLFRYRSGGAWRLGEMGEAGPEAIVPLDQARGGGLGVAALDSSGRSLGVALRLARGRGGRLSVVIDEQTAMAQAMRLQQGGAPGRRVPAVGQPAGARFAAGGVFGGWSVPAMARFAEGGIFGSTAAGRRMSDTAAAPSSAPRADPGQGAITYRGGDIHIDARTDQAQVFSLVQQAQMRERRAVFAELRRRGVPGL